MSSLLDKLKKKLNEAPAQASAQIVEIPSHARTFVCKNHFNLNQKGQRVVTRVIITFLPNEHQRTCECGIIYKRITL
jgi:hypothetical protein